MDTIFDWHLDSEKVLQAFKKETQNLKLMLSISTLKMYMIRLTKDYPGFSCRRSHLIWFLEATSTNNQDLGKDYFLIYKVHEGKEVVIAAIDINDTNCVFPIDGDLRINGTYYERRLSADNMVFFAPL